MKGIYRRDGTPYPDGQKGIMEWCKDVGDHKMQRVALDELSNGVEISTVWLGLDHRWNKGRPLIFETMLFVPQIKVHIINGKVHHHNRESIGETWRYSTEEEAIRGHKMLVKKWSKFKSIQQIMCKRKKSGQRKRSS